MPRRVLKLALFAAILVGAVMAWRSGAERERLEGRYRRMASAAGDLPIADPTKACFLALDTGEPLHFAWRMRAPANFNATFSVASGGGRMSSAPWRSEPAEAIARVRFRREESGRLMIFSKLLGAGGLTSVEPDMAKFLEGREGELIVERFAADGPAEMAPDDSVVLVRVAMPESMIAEARAALPAHVVDRHVPDFATVTLGPEGVRPKPPGGTP